MERYKQPLAVTLTTEQWLAVQCALTDAWELNDLKKFPMHSLGIIALKRAIAAQSQEAIDAAAREVDAAIIARAA
jgi:predicted solute-binding protein